MNVENDLSGDYVLTDDIDLSGIENWTPIFDSGATYIEDGFFSGSLDGQGHKIINLNGKYDPDNPWFEIEGEVMPRGLFLGLLDATIENIIFENIMVDGFEDDSEHPDGAYPVLDAVGCLTSVICNSTVRNVQMSGSVKGRRFVAPLAAIGVKKRPTDKIIIDKFGFNGTIHSKLFSSGIITTLYTEDQNMTFNEGDIEIENSYVNGDLMIPVEVMVQ